jgi:NADH-quinone oxidoreductase subunit N
MLAGLSVLKDTGGAAAILFYLGAYLLMNLGAFLVLVALENVFGGTDLRHLRGAMRREPVLAVALCIFLFSLTGLPPFAGFMGKWFIMVKLADSARYGTIAWIGFNSVVSLYYYMKIAKAVAMDPPMEGVEGKGRVPFSYNLIAVCKSAALLLLFVYSERVLDICQRALNR